MVVLEKKNLSSSSSSSSSSQHSRILSLLLIKPQASHGMYFVFGVLSVLLFFHGSSLSMEGCSSTTTISNKSNSNSNNRPALMELAELDDNVLKELLTTYRSRSHTLTTNNSPNSPNSDSDSDNNNNNNNNNNGWNTIQVFYGNSSSLPVTPRQWKSQVGQDKAVIELLKGLKGGYFIDLAANDASFISNTYTLETRYNWKGLCIEANSKYWNRLAYRSNCQTIGAVVGHVRMKEINFYFGPSGPTQEVMLNEPISDREKGTLGGMVGTNFDNKRMRGVTAKRYTVTLQEIFEKFHVPTTIDYLSLDVEGAESYIMSSFPFELYTFKIMTVERPKDELKELLQSKGYIFFKQLSGWGETLWIHESFNRTL